jgi:transposase
MPALTAMAYNPAIKKFADRLKAKGKPSKVVIGAVMRKLLRIIFVILKSGRPFDVNFVQGT